MEKEKIKNAMHWEGFKWLSKQGEEQEEDDDEEDWLEEKHDCTRLPEWQRKDTEKII